MDTQLKLTAAAEHKVEAGTDSSSKAAAGVGVGESAQPGVVEMTAREAAGGTATGAGQAQAGAAANVGLPVSPILTGAGSSSSSSSSTSGAYSAGGSSSITAVAGVKGVGLGQNVPPPDSTFVHAIANIALLSSVILILSPATFFYKMITTRGENIKSSKRQLVILLPYLLLWVSACLWATWAHLEQRSEIFQLQMFGILFYSGYVAIFCVAASIAQRHQVQSVAVGTALFVGLSILHGTMLMDSARSSFVFAYSALIFQIVLYLVPFIQLADVVRTGVVAVFPLPLCLCSMISSLLWVWYSWIKWSPAFWLASLAGFVFNGIQVSVVVYIQWKYGSSIIESCKLEAGIATGRLPFLMQHGMRQQIDLRKAKAIRRGGDLGSGGLASLYGGRGGGGGGGVSGSGVHDELTMAMQQKTGEHTRLLEATRL